MSVKRKFGTAAAITVAAALLGSGHADAAACSPTGFFRDGINMTAAVIASGDIANGTVNASGCNIGIYYGPGTAGTVSNTQVSGANYFGVVVSGDADGFSAAGAATVDVTDNNVHDIGESPLNGSQHGVAIYYRACDAGASATGIISGNAISKYQRAGSSSVAPVRQPRSWAIRSPAKGRSTTSPRTAFRSATAPAAR
jgi:hypothetical protein